MSALLKKEIRLAASPLTYYFIAFAAMTLIPGYPILCGAFFICLGMFQSYQSAREANDIVYSALLPVAKRDIVKGKFMFAIFIELVGFILMLILTLLRMTIFADSPAYRSNALMNANLFFLGMALVIFALFNLIFIGGFFKTAYKFGKPFVLFIIVNFIVIGIAEALHYIPGLEVLNSFGFDNIPLQICLLVGGILFFALVTLLAYRKACISFEKIDL